MAKKQTTPKAVVKKAPAKKVIDETFVGEPRNGWNTEVETIALLEALVKNNKVMTVLETGVFHGETTQAFLSAIPKGGYYVGIDIEDHRTEKTKQAFSNHQGKAFEFILDNSLNAMQKMPDKHFDLIFLDSNHAYDHVMAEFKIAERLLSDNGIIAMHDSRHIIDVKRVFEYALSFNYHGINFTTPEGRGIAFLQRKVK